MKKILLFITLILGTFFSIAQPKLGQTMKSASGQTIETPLGFQNRETVENDKVTYFVGIDKSNKIMYIETRSTSFKVENYSFSTRFNDFKNYNYCRFFEGWGYYLRINANWCAYFGKAKPTKDTKPVLFFNYNFGKTEGKAVFDSNYEEALAAEIKANKEKEEKKKREKEEQAKKKAAFEAAEEEAKKKKEEAKKEELAKKEKLKAEKEKLIQAEKDKKKQAEEDAKKKKEEFEKNKAREEQAKKEKAKKEAENLAKLKAEADKRKAQEDAKKKAEEERKQQYARELAEFNAKKEAEKKAKEAEKLRKSEEFRTGQKIENTQDISKNSTTTSNGKLSSGEKLLDDVFKSKLKKGYTDYISYVKKNKKYTESYPLVLINYKEIKQMSASDLGKIKKIVSTTVFKKGHKRCDDFKDKGGENGVVIIKAE